MKKYIIWVVGGLLLATVVVIGFLGKDSIKEALGGITVSTASWSYQYSDVVGTHITTSTQGVLLTTATSTYVSVIGRQITEAIYMIKATEVSTTTGQYALFAVEGSNDQFCDVTTTTVGGEVNAQHINWFSAMDNIRGKAHATAFTNASTTATIAWNDILPGFGNSIILTDLNYHCLRLNVSGNSSTVYVGISTKSKQ